MQNDQRKALLAVMSFLILGAVHGADTPVLSTTKAPTVASPTNKIPTFEDITIFTADPIAPASDAYWKDFKISRDDLKNVLRDEVVTRERWLHGYSHVAEGDRTGTITLKDKTKIRWMVKPGGLAYLTFPNNTVIYLVQREHR